MSVLRAIAVFLCGFLSLRWSRAQIIRPGACPHVTVMQNFDIGRYMGKWYEAEKYFFLFEIGGKCITAEYIQKETGLIGIVNSQISALSGIKSEITGRAMPASRADEGKLMVSFPSLPYNVEAPYWVLETDYETYSVVWSCYQLLPFHTANVWILTRERHPPMDVLEKAYSVLDRNYISRAFLMRTNQRDCRDTDE